MQEILEIQKFHNKLFSPKLKTDGKLGPKTREGIKKIHQKYFQREKSLFVTKNSRDKEEKFYIYKFRDMLECGGHYIYYEKNLEMQNYMIASRKRSGFTPSEIIEDRVTKNFRSLVREKAEQNEQRTHSRMVYAMSTFLVLVVLVIGITMINNYDKMKSVQNTLDKLSQNVSKTEEKDKEEEAVETLGDVQSSQEEEDERQEETQEGDNQEGTEEENNTTGEEEKPEDSNTGETLPSDTTEQETPTITTTKTYIVKEGDTLETICRNEYGNNTNIQKICELNQLEDGNLIFIGQKLLLP